MEGGVVSLVIIKLPYCLHGELIVSLKLVTAYKALVHQNVLFFLIMDQYWFFFSSLCFFCMYLHVGIPILCKDT